MVSWFIERAVRTDGCTRAPRVCRISWYRPRRLRQWSAAVHTVQPEPLVQKGIQCLLIVSAQT